MNVQSPLATADKPAEQRNACRLCGAQLSHTLVDLGMSPLCESIRSSHQLDEMEMYFPLHALICDRCFLVQLKQYVPPEEIFRDYAYFSSYSASWVEHAKTYCTAITRKLGLNGSSFVVELASNDGYLLQHFLPHGIPVLGIEPALNVAKAAIAKGIPTRTEFFGTELAGKLVTEGRRADLIVANNVLAQVPDLNDFVAGIALLLKQKGRATIEFPHLPRLIEGNQFDTIYHEHFSYFSLIAVSHLAQRHGLKLVDVEELETHGGSLRVHLALQSARQAVEPNVGRLLAGEREAGYDRLETYRAFAARVQRTKRNLLACLIGLKAGGKKICGYGAPGKGNTLLNYCGIGTDFLDFTVDRNPHKHGWFTPGMHIPIRPVEAIDEAQPDYVLILPWNLKREIVQQMRRIGDWSGKFILPIPDATIIDPAEIQA